MLCTWKQRSAQVVDTDEHRESTDPSTRRREPCTARSAATPTHGSWTPAPPTTVRASAGVVSAPSAGSGSRPSRPPRSVWSNGPARPSRSAARRSRRRPQGLSGRPVTEDDLALLAQRVEETIRGLRTGRGRRPRGRLAVLEPLRELDEVAYLRFASVYQAFTSLGTSRPRSHAAAGRAACHGRKSPTPHLTTAYAAGAPQGERAAYANDDRPQTDCRWSPIELTQVTHRKSRTTTETVGARAGARKNGTKGVQV